MRSKERETQSSTEDFSVDVDWEITDRLRVNFEAQRIASDLRQDSIIGTMSTWANIDLDLRGKVPQVQCLAPLGAPRRLLHFGPQHLALQLRFRSKVRLLCGGLMRSSP